MIELRRRYSGSKGSDSPSFSRLPKGYQEVEWIENHGDAYINTNIVARKGTTFYLDYMFIDVAEHQNGAGKPDDGERFIIGINQSGQVNVALGSNANLSNTLEFGIKYKFILDEQTSSFTINDKIFNIPDTLQSSITTICIFARNSRQDGITYLGKKARCYACRIESYSNCLLDLIPCYRTSDRVAGMYDIVNNVFYTNAGTGEFSYGPDVHYNIPPEYQQVEYLETQGDGAYIKTNVPYDSTQDDYEIECKYLIIQRTNFTHIFGASEGGNYNSIILAQSDASNYYLALFNKTTIQYQYKFQHAYGYSVVTICKFSVSNITMSDSENNSPITVTENSQGANGIESINKVTFCLFSADQSLATSPYMKAYEYIIRKGNVTLCNLIPCYRKEDNVAGMYDLVSGEFYTNAGTGKFEVGPNVIG